MYRAYCGDDTYGGQHGGVGAAGHLPVGCTAAHVERGARGRATTAEYAVVLVAATGFAAVLVALLKSDTIKTLLTNIVKKSLSVG